jgi:Tfp pilus assembly PilM family ATPase
MASKELILGLSLGAKRIQAVELDQDDASNTLRAVDEWDNTLQSNGKKSVQGTEVFVSRLGEFIKENRVKARKVSIAFDSSHLFLNTIPLEDGLSRTEMNEHINWELMQFFPETSPREFITDMHVLSQDSKERLSQVLSVSVRREDINTMQDVVKKLGLVLHIIDVDHFSADTALRINYPDTSKKFVALVGVKENRLDISLIRNGNLESYSYSMVSSNDEIVEQIGYLSRETPDIFSIVAYGTHLDKDLLVQIRRGASLLVEALNPLRHVKVSEELSLSGHISGPSYRYTSAVGVALRRD